MLVTSALGGETPLLERRYWLAAEDDVVRVIILQANCNHLSADHS